MIGLSEGVDIPKAGEVKHKRFYPKNRKSVRGYKARHNPDGSLRSSNGGARDTRSVKLVVKHGGRLQGKLAHVRLDRRSHHGKLYESTCRSLLAHLAHEPTEAQQIVIDNIGRLRVAADIAWVELMATGIKEGTVAYDAFLKAVRAQHGALELLGLERRCKVMNLQDYIEGAAGKVPGEPA